MGRTSDARDRFLPGQIRHMNKRVVEGRKDMRNAEVAFAFSELRAKLDGLFLLNAGFLRRLSSGCQLSHPPVHGTRQSQKFHIITSYLRSTYHVDGLTS